MTPLGPMDVVSVVAPVMSVVLLGWLLGRWRAIDIAALTEVVVYAGGPALMFVSLAKGSLGAADIGLLAGASVTIVCGVGLLVARFARLSGSSPGVLYLPAMFMNSGNMLLPLSLFAFGRTGLDHAVVIFATLSLLQSTLGVLIASGRAHPGEALRLPYIYAVVIALAVRGFGWQVPVVILRPLELLADTAVPLMLLALGLRLRTIHTTAWTRPLLVTVARMVGGYAVATVFVYFTGIDGINRAVVLLASVMPAAVINFVFAEKYGNVRGEAATAEVATAVFASTVVSFVTIPLVLAFGI